MASPRTSVEPAAASEIREPKEGLSAQTLVIAAISSAIAAIVVSHFWEQGTILASAMTPVIVAIVSDLLKKPVESERLRSSVRNVSNVSRPRSGRTPKVLAPPPRGLDDPAPDEGKEAGPVRVYSSGSNKRPRGLGGSPRRRLHLKVAVITGLVAFLIAAAALTLPELVFGGSVGGGNGSTTYFGGGEDSNRSGESQDGDSQGGQPDEPANQGDEQQDPEAPVDPGDSGDGGEEPAPTPEQPTPPAPTTPPEAPTQPQPETPSQGGTSP